MPFVISIQQAQADYPEYKFLEALTPSEQKAAFHVVDSNGQHLCLKIIAPNYDLDRLNREIKALQSLNHPNVAQFKEYTFSTKQGQQKHYLIEEFIEGDDLSSKLAPSLQWSTREASSFFAEVCDGLAGLREINIVHRDLKPSNIRVRPSGSPVIIDLGVARHLDLPDITRTDQGAGIGTPRYFAPEQFSGTKYDIEHRTDLFAVGVLMYEALVGYHPFIQPIIQSGIPLPEAVCSSEDHLSHVVFVELPKDLKLLIGKLLKKKRVDRPHSAVQVAEILRKIGGS